MLHLPLTTRYNAVQKKQTPARNAEPYGPPSASTLPEKAAQTLNFGGARCV